MYAIIQDGGKQYQAIPGKAIELEHKNQKPGTELEFSDVLFYQNGEEIEIGRPLLKNVKVKAVIEKDIKGDKITIFRYRRRKDSKVKKGHRQKYSRVRIQKIVKE